MEQDIPARHTVVQCAIGVHLHPVGEGAPRRLRVIQKSLDELVVTWIHVTLLHYVMQVYSCKRVVIQ